MKIYYKINSGPDPLCNCASTKAPLFHPKKDGQNMSFCYWHKAQTEYDFLGFCISSLFLKGSGCKRRETRCLNARGQSSYVKKKFQNDLFSCFGTCHSKYEHF